MGNFEKQGEAARLAPDDGGRMHMARFDERKTVTLLAFTALLSCSLAFPCAAHAGPASPSEADGAASSALTLSYQVVDDGAAGELVTVPVDGARPADGPAESTVPADGAGGADGAGAATAPAVDVPQRPEGDGPPDGGSDAPADVSSAAASAQSPTQAARMAENRSGRAGASGAMGPAASGTYAKTGADVRAVLAAAGLSGSCGALFAAVGAQRRREDGR